MQQLASNMTVHSLLLLFQQNHLTYLICSGRGMMQPSAAADVAAGQIMANRAQHTDWAEQFSGLNLNQGPPNAWADDFAKVITQHLQRMHASVWGVHPAPAADAYFSLGCAFSTCSQCQASAQHLQGLWNSRCAKQCNHVTERKLYLQPAVQYAVDSGCVCEIFDDLHHWLTCPSPSVCN